MAEPLSREERDGIQRYGVTLPEMYARFADYEATVRAVEAERDALREALGAIRAYSTGGHSYHRTIGEDCGVDACGVCLIEGTAIAALAAHPPRDGEGEG